MSFSSFTFMSIPSINKSFEKDILLFVYNKYIRTKKQEQQINSGFFFGFFYFKNKYKKYDTVYHLFYFCIKLVILKEEFTFYIKFIFLFLS